MGFVDKVLKKLEQAAEQAQPFLQDAEELLAIAKEEASALKEKVIEDAKELANTVTDAIIAELTQQPDSTKKEPTLLDQLRDYPFGEEPSDEEFLNDKLEKLKDLGAQFDTLKIGEEDLRDLQTELNDLLKNSKDALDPQTRKILEDLLVPSDLKETKTEPQKTETSSKGSSFDLTEDTATSASPASAAKEEKTAASKPRKSSHGKKTSVDFNSCGAPAPANIDTAPVKTVKTKKNSKKPSPKK